MLVLQLGNFSINMIKNYKKHNIIEEVLVITKKSGETYFDILVDLSAVHLKKLLKVCNLLAK